LIDTSPARFLPPTLLSLLLFTFVLLLRDIATLLGFLISRSTDFLTIARIFANLLPSILALTIPMAFLLGVLLAFAGWPAKARSSR